MLMVPIDNIHIMSGFNVRIHDDDYELHVEEIKESILQHGFYQNEPLSGFASREGDITFIQLVGGFTRFEAAKRARVEGAPLDALPVVLKPTGTSLIDLTVALNAENTTSPLR